MVSIDKYEIGPGRRTFIIAEAGVNHDGDVNKALKLIDAALAAGADAVKFQVFRADELVTGDARTANYQLKQSGDTSQRNMLARLELHDAALRQLVDHARAKGIIFLATPFSVGDVARLMALGVPAIKIASTDLNNFPLLSAAIRTLGSAVPSCGVIREAPEALSATQLNAAHKGRRYISTETITRPLIVSTGAAQEKEIHEAISWFRDQGMLDRLILMHCVSAYPTPIEAANLRAIRTMQQMFDVPVGFSDHTLSIHAGAWAVCAGAVVLEKHLTLIRGATGPDHAMSLDPAMFTEYVRAVRICEAALGTGGLGMQDIEAEVRAVARRSVVAVRAISRGTVVTADMLTVKRPGGGIRPECMESLLGRKALKDIESDTMLAWDMLQ